MADRFTEIESTYLPHQAMLEATRCLLCSEAPCSKACPAGVDIRRFIKKLRFHNPVGAYFSFLADHPFPGICGRACPSEELCEKECRSQALSDPIKIPKLHRYLEEQAKKNGLKAEKPAPKWREKVAVIGSGPAGLACAAFLAHRGYRVEILEAFSQPGGMLLYGIPPYRLPSELVRREIERVKGLGVAIQAGKKITALDTLFAQGFTAVFIACGLWKSRLIGLPGENLAGVLPALEFLEKANLYARNLAAEKPQVGKRVVIIGGGNVAMDCGICAKLLGAEDVHLLCLESFCEMPAFPREKEFAQGYDLHFHTRIKPLEIVGEQGRVAGFKGIEIKWKQPGICLPENAEEIPGSEIVLSCDTLIEAIGQAPDKEFLAALTGVELTAQGRIKVVPQTLQTSRAGVFAGGDVVNGGKTIVAAAGEGKKAAEQIDRYLTALRTSGAVMA